MAKECLRLAATLVVAGAGVASCQASIWLPDSRLFDEAAMLAQTDGAASEDTAEIVHAPSSTIHTIHLPETFEFAFELLAQMLCDLSPAGSSTSGSSSPGPSGSGGLHWLATKPFALAGDDEHSTALADEPALRPPRPRGKNLLRPPQNA